MNDKRLDILEVAGLANMCSLVNRAISKSSGEHKSMREKLNSDRKHILNPLSHNVNRPENSEEL